MFQGKTLRLMPLDDGFVELCFDRTDESVNKLDQLAIDELRQAVAALMSQAAGVRGLLVSSAKDSFIVGADIFEFTALFERAEGEIEAQVRDQGAVIAALSQLPFPAVAAINGTALGGGFEVALACDHRVLAERVTVGLPEVTLGVVPAYGGSTRLPRIAGSTVALQWVSTGAPHKADAALAAGAVDELVGSEVLRAAALNWLRGAVDGCHDWRARRTALAGPTALDLVALEQARAAAARTSHHFPAAAAFVQFLADTAGWPAHAALQEEARVFTRLCKTEAAHSLVRLFVNDQFLKKKAKSYVKQARMVRQAAVLGAGIMGGGIACTSAVRGVPVLMKDIGQAALDIGMNEADKLLAKQMASGRLQPEQARQVRASICPQLDFSGFDAADIVVEAIVENLAVKKRVLAEVESLVRDDAIIASNTSSLSIEEMACGLRRPHNFVGMHFFNPVPQMPLVEVIRGPQTLPVAAATAAGYAVAMGKTPIVVQDCPGFLVNRVLTPYLLAFLRLVRDGADFQQVDRVMETFGWPMGPAYLSDVVGMDTLMHVLHVIAGGYGSRMQAGFPLAVELLVEKGRLGQKSGAGFYRYENDAKGRPKKLPDEASMALVSALQPDGPKHFSDTDIVDRMMLPMVLEAARCLDEAVVDSAIEVDMGLVLGLGFPRDLGGVLHWADRVGLQEILRRCERYKAISPLYEPAQAFVQRADAGKGFHNASR
ncbi:fatty acid oxidation complex subunit alpha FadB [Azohydromonas australica]|uniref:fatty acid oxidation complex subunit alpha FadB n=1 Tax=Azohydromonas australica TaxID=364039 RepID=UPI0003FAB3E0|nr:fatty acid oxidation complex subunit alpha FadB [Azohydromonas australica]